MRDGDRRGKTWFCGWLAGCFYVSLLCGCGIEDRAVGSGKPARAGDAAAATAAAKPAPIRVDLRWPTPNSAFADGKDYADFVQPTVSGDPRSGLFGSVRSGGRQFHEGLDLFPVTRDRKGEAADPVGAALAGVVRYVSHSGGNSNYGRYVVLEHPLEKPAVYTLYAHLQEVRPGLLPGSLVAAGELLGTMGRSSSGSPIPKERAHLHFEIGLRATDNFAAWYADRGFGSPNPHGIWNGMNLLGVDPLALFTLHAKSGGLSRLTDFFADLPPALTLRIARSMEPDFVRRYPELVQPNSDSGVASPGGWEITFTSSGLPFRWQRLGAGEVLGWKPGEVRILKVDASLLAENRGRKIARQRAGKWVPHEDLESILGQLFLR